MDCDKSEDLPYIAELDSDEESSSDDDIDSENEKGLRECLNRLGYADNYAAKAATICRNGESCKFLKINRCKFFHPKKRRDRNKSRSTKVTNIMELRAQHREEEKAALRRIARKEVKELEKKQAREMAEFQKEAVGDREKAELEIRERMRGVLEENSDRDRKAVRKYVELDRRVRREREELLEKLRINEEVLKHIMADHIKKTELIAAENSQREKHAREEQLNVAKDVEEKREIKMKQIATEHKDQMFALKETHNQTEEAIENRELFEQMPANNIATIQPNLQLLEYIDHKILEKEEELQCPVCLETASVPIYMCSEQHLVCSVCRPQISR